MLESKVIDSKQNPFFQGLVSEEEIASLLHFVQFGFCYNMQHNLHFFLLFRYKKFEEEEEEDRKRRIKARYPNKDLLPDELNPETEYYQFLQEQRQEDFEENKDFIFERSLMRSCPSRYVGCLYKCDSQEKSSEEEDGQEQNSEEEVSLEQRIEEEDKKTMKSKNERERIKPMS